MITFPPTAAFTVYGETKLTPKSLVTRVIGTVITGNGPTLSCTPKVVTPGPGGALPLTLTLMVCGCDGLSEPEDGLNVSQFGALRTLQENGPPVFRLSVRFCEG